jgi:hypothetical protein
LEQKRKVLRLFHALRYYSLPSDGLYVAALCAATLIFGFRCIFLWWEGSKNSKIWIQINNTKLDIGQALVEKGVPKEDIVIGFQPVYIRQISGYAIA